MYQNPATQDAARIDGEANWKTTVDGEIRLTTWDI